MRIQFGCAASLSPLPSTDFEKVLTQYYIVRKDVMVTENRKICSYDFHNQVNFPNKFEGKYTSAESIQTVVGGGDCSLCKYC